MRALAAPIAIVIAGCAYQTGSFNYAGHAFAGQRATIGCLDLAVDRRHDADGVAVLVYDFANRCDGAATVDLAYAMVTGRTETGDQIDLKPYDPRNEIRPMKLDGRSAGTETIAYASDQHLAQVCVDLATVAHVEGEPKIVCASSEPPR